jgi:hypothetical protein
VEEPVRIAVQYFCNLRPQLIAGFTEAIDDLAQMRFVNSQHLRHSVLTKAAGIDPQLQIRVDVALNWHCILPNVYFALATAYSTATLAASHLSNLCAKAFPYPSVNILLYFAARNYFSGSPAFAIVSEKEKSFWKVNQRFSVRHKNETALSFIRLNSISKQINLVLLIK